MPRIRTIKPDFWIDEKIGKLKRDERLLFIGLWNLADDQGVFKANAGYIKGQLFSYDDELRISTIESWLTSLKNARLIVPFIFNDEGYYLIRTFQDHQLINRPSKAKFPEDTINQLLTEHSLNTHGVLTEDSLHEGKGKEGNKEGKGNPNGLGNPLPSFKNSIEKQKWEEFKQTLPTDRKEFKDKMAEYFHANKPDFIEPFAYLWNIFATENGLAEISKSTDKRMQKLRARCRNPDFDFIEILKGIKRSGFLKGNDGKWKVDFDWIIENNDNYVQIIEGKYN